MLHWAGESVILADEEFLEEETRDERTDCCVGRVRGSEGTCFIFDTSKAWRT